MKILCLLLLCGLAISQKLETLSAYQGVTNPENCYRAGWNKVAKLRIYTQQELDDVKTAVKTCIGQQALVNPKIEAVKEKLIEKIYEGIHFRAVKTPECYQKMIADGLKNTECWKKGIDPEDRCSKDFGTKSCRIQYMNESCGKQYFEDYKELIRFVDKKPLHPCVVTVLRYGQLKAS
ncbi:unnamed protein product [Caenorhabditis angaria]|uniref:T20D4.11-like domain-containing protein n=1 Tax=Caenorhabditis angaria TaxID=860376 RepID=A0A9P1IG57_9PELO|nr:unnamed protein product [Caenorhabditis angaria]